MKPASVNQSTATSASHWPPTKTGAAWWNGKNDRSIAILSPAEFLANLGPA